MIVCGRCTNSPDAPRGQQQYHASVDAVKACYEYARVYGADHVFRCGWMVEADVIVGEDEYGPEWERRVVDCGAPAHANTGVHADDNGWECFNGHVHLAYGSAAQQREERFEAAVEHMASWNGNIAGRLDAGFSHRDAVRF